MEKQDVESQDTNHAEKHLEDLEKQALTAEPASIAPSQKNVYKDTFELSLPRSAVCYPICSIFWCLWIGCFTICYYNGAKKAAGTLISNHSETE